MTVEVQPLPKNVRQAVRRHCYPGRFAGPVAAALFNLAMFVGLLAACGYGVHTLWTRALADARFKMNGDTLGVGGAVRECPESIAEISAIGKRFSGRSILDPMLIADLEHAYLDSVWVKRVNRMRRSFPNRVDLELQLRVPVAQVVSGGRYWLVDMEGMVLPVEGGTAPFHNLPEIVGVTARVIGSRPAPGQIWQDEGVAGGMGILRAFWGSPLAETLPVDRVVVNTGVYQGGGEEREIRRRFEVVTAAGVVVRWGTYSDIDSPDEITSAEKMWNLQDLLRREEALRPGVCFDVRTRLPGYSLIQ